MPIVALVDYDNVKSELTEYSSRDVLSNLDDIAQQIVGFLPKVPCAEEEVRMRLYGGWIDESGRFTHRASWIMAALGSLERRRGNTIIIPEIVTSLAVRLGRVLIGTYRAHPTPEQKMVDTMMTVDAIHFASIPDTFVVIASDDDDMVPSIIAGQRQEHRPMSWLRRRKPCGRGPNDKLCMDDGVNLFGITE